MRETCEDYQFMTPPKSVTLNGREYDAITGLPIEPPKHGVSKPQPNIKHTPRTQQSAMNATTVHGNVQRSQTLYRRATKKPDTPAKPVVKQRTSPGKHMDIARSNRVTHFAPHPKTVTSASSVPSVTKAVTAPIQHATKTTKKTASRSHQTTEIAPALKSKAVKDAEIAAAIAKPSTKSTKQHKKPISAVRRYSIVAGIIIVVLVASLYAAWRFVPTFSVSIAANQAGIEATYPEFTPDGYSLHQPVTAQEGEVTLKFKSNSNDNYYSIIQTRSSWDSSAVLDNIVSPAAKENYVTTKERGLTIYTYDNTAVWVNGGILYQIVSNAPLSGEQIRRIATSL